MTLMHETEVIIIGGGATGAGVLRDLSLRGIRAVLLEKGDITSGTTGRNHGLLHSGARYAVKDIESARECISENRILKKIAGHCIEETGGLFITLPEDDRQYHEQLLSRCLETGIDAVEIPVSEALKKEPGLNPEIVSAIKVPDGIIDPFRLTSANILDAKEHGAKVFTYMEVCGIFSSSGKTTGVKALSGDGSVHEFHGNIIVNAAGIWGQRICLMAGSELKMLPSKGSMLIVDYRINNTVINRCRKPSDADIMVPGDTVSILGTTSMEIPYDEIDSPFPENIEIDMLLREGERMVPNLSKTRALRAYSGVRPLLAPEDSSDGRNITRGITLIDHKSRDGIDGLVTIAGGKLMTYRLMAEMTSDLVSEKLGKKTSCRTHSLPLPGSEKVTGNIRKFYRDISNSVVGSTMYRHGKRIFNILKNDRKNFRLICECEMVTEGEIEYALNNLDVTTLIDLRRRTRIGMGPCQGELCSYRAAALFNEYGKASPHESTAMLKDFLEERWKGIKPVLWGDSLRESELTYWIYTSLFGLDELPLNDTEREEK